MIDKKADVVVCNYFYEKEGNLKIAIKKQSEIITYEQLLYENCITTGAILAKKEVFESVKFFDEKMPRYQDWELVLRIAKKYQIIFLDQGLLTLHYQSQSISNSTSKEKKYVALDRIYSKNKEAIDKNKKAYAHIMWSMGLYSLFLENKRIDFLRLGVFSNGINFKRLIIYILVKCGMSDFVKIMYSKNH